MKLTKPPLNEEDKTDGLVVVVHNVQEGTAGPICLGHGMVGSRSVEQLDDVQMCERYMTANLSRS